MSAAYSFFFNHTAPPQTYTLSLHDALPISPREIDHCIHARQVRPHPMDYAPLGALERHLGDQDSAVIETIDQLDEDRKSTRLNSSHMSISYAVFCLKKKKQRDPALRHARAA